MSLAVIWPDAQNTPVYRVNQWLAQINQDGHGAPEDVLLTAGYIAPPILLGTPEEQATTARALGAVPVKSLVRLSLSRSRVEELITVLQATLAGYDQQQRGQS